tara:strand:+ start:431 stop:2053 length:1623 start_codon:yes stop_codon:yes gene_type:complete
MKNTPISLKSLLLNANKALAEKKYSEGKSILEKINSLNPNVFEVNYNLGLINLKLNNLDDAAINFEKAIKLNPKLSHVYFNLGLVYDRKKDFNLAIKNFQKVIEIDPNNSHAFYNLGSLYQEIFKRTEAEKHLKKSIELNPKFLLAYNNLFDVYDRSNQTEKFRELLSEVKKNFDETNLLSFYSGMYEYKNKNYELAIHSLQNIKLKEEFFIQDIKRHGMLAKSYDFLKDYEKAFNHFELNNNLTNKFYGKNIDENIYLKYVNQRINFFKNFKQTNWNVDSKQNEVNSPYFLIGFPRSGTTLLDTILRTHHTVEVIEEKPLIRNFLIKLEKKTKNNFNHLNNLDDDFIKEMQNFYFFERKKYIKNINTKIIIDKLPLNIIHIGEILRFFPNAKFILALRHPYDSVLSCFMQQFTLNPAMKNFLTINGGAYLYDLVMSLWEIYTNNFSVNFHSIRYEDLVSNFETETKKVFKYLELEWNDNIKDFHLTAKNRTDISTPSYDQVTSPIYSRSISRWNNYEKRFENEKKYLDKWVKKFNYKIN